MVIDGKKISKEILDGLKLLPKPEKFLAAILVGEEKSSLDFLKQKEKIARELEIDFRLYKFPAEIKNDELRKEVLKIDGHKTCGGVIIQLPLPEHLNRHYILNAVSREKDVDVLGERALGAFYAGRNPVLPPSVGTVVSITRNIRMDPNITNNNTRSNTSRNKHIIEKELSYKLNGMFFLIQNELGRFCRERQYADAFEEKLKNQNIKYKREQPLPIANRKSNFSDFIIENKILVELKSKPVNTREDYFQVMRYLETANLELGLLVNFRLEYLKIKRVLNPKFSRNSVHPNIKYTELDSVNSDSFANSGYGKVAVVGRGLLVGKPVAIWLMDKASELAVFASGSDLSELKNFDLIVSGVGKAGIIKPEMLKENSVVIDFGYDINSSGKIAGDFDSESLKAKSYNLKAISYTPTPGGTGPILIAKLMENFYRLNSEM